MGGGGARIGLQRLFELLRSRFEFLAVDKVPAPLEVRVPVLILVIVVSRKTAAHSCRHQYENGAEKNRPQTFHAAILNASRPKVKATLVHPPFQNSDKKELTEVRFAGIHCA
jgi:hypothetical protein